MYVLVYTEPVLMSSPFSFFNIWLQKQVMQPPLIVCIDNVTAELSGVFSILDENSDLNSSKLWTHTVDELLSPCRLKMFLLRWIIL